MKTLVLHADDRSTDFLKPIYSELKNKTVYTKYNEKSGDKYKLIKEAKQHDRIIFLGHGTPGGLLGWGNLFHDPEFINVLKTKNDQLIYIWCHASTYVIKHKLKGFSTGMFISEVGEASFYSIQATQKQIDHSNNLFAELVGKNLLSGNINMEELKKYVESKYVDDYCKVIKYNRERLKYLDGTMQPPVQSHYSYYNLEDEEESFGYKNIYKNIFKNGKILNRFLKI